MSWIYHRSIAIIGMRAVNLLNPAFNCPLLKCVYDEPGGRQRCLKRQRDRQIVRLFTIEGRRVKELALMFGLSQRTVQRALKNSLLTPLRPSLKRKIKRED